MSQKHDSVEALQKWAQVRQRPAKGKTGGSLKHESAIKHVTGDAIYVDDMPEWPNTLHVAIGKSTIAHGDIVSMDLTEVWASEGVVDVITFDDIPGETDIGPVFAGDPLLAEKTVEYVGQPIFAVAANSHELAQRAAAKAVIEYEESTPILDVQTALKERVFVRPTHTHAKGDADKALQKAKHTLKGDFYVKGQEHFYLESQVSFVVPTEDHGMKVYTSSQHPTEVQKLVSEVLGVAINQVQVEVRRMGGGFGGKETQAAPWACMAAVVAHRTHRPVKIRLSRKDDMVLTGKRHDFYNQYTIGFDDEGRIEGANVELAAKCGFSPDLSDAIVDRAMFHCDNAYNLKDCKVVGHRCKTNTVSNTAFRGFGGPQGMVVAEYMVDDIARHVGRDALDVRYANLYQEGDVTHYGQIIEHYPMAELLKDLEDQCDYRSRRDAINQFNKTNRFKKRGMALTPVKFGISFTVTHLNQAGALVHIYTDGSIHLNHGGTEMGQGLFTKVAQVVANEFDVDVNTVMVSSTNTEKVPNTSPTAASSGTDLNGKAAQNACEILKQRLVEFAQQQWQANQVTFERNHVVMVTDNDEIALAFPDFIQQAYMHRVSLSSTGYYKTPKIHYDRENAHGRPFFYYALGAACSEVEIDTLTGEYDVLRTDILHDVGQSLNPAIDIGQIEGAFAQGMGWLTTEELVWNDQGALASSNPATYKIPTAADMPTVFNTRLFERPNDEATIYHSKAVGEPPFMLGMSVWLALRDAVSCVADHKVQPPLDTPATPERVYNAVQFCRQQAMSASDSQGKGD